MQKSRLEAFSDGVLAIIITIMVLELRVPHGTDLASLRPLLPVFVSYVLSFVNLGIYWNNHQVWASAHVAEIIYCQGHETYAIYQQAEPLRVIENAVRWLGAEVR